MAVLLDTSIGELVIDLNVKECPLASQNFINLCKCKYYNGCLFWNVQSNYIVQSGDPTGTGKGGMSAMGLLHDNPTLTFNDEINKLKKHNKIGLVSMTSNHINCNKSQFFITLRDNNMDHLDEKHTIFGEIAEGLDVLDKMNDVYCDDAGRPYQDIRIRHTFILDDPFENSRSNEEVALLEKKIPPVSPVPPELIKDAHSISNVVKVSTFIPIEESVAARIP